MEDNLIAFGLKLIDIGAVSDQQHITDDFGGTFAEDVSEHV